MQLFRREALDEHQQQGGPGRILRVAPPSYLRAFGLILWLVSMFVLIVSIYDVDLVVRGAGAVSYQHVREVVAAPTTGPVVEVYVSTHEQVAAGDVLLRLRDDVLAESIARAERQLADADALVLRLAGDASQPEVLERALSIANSQRAVAAAQRDELMQQAREIEIVAPFAARIGEVYVGEGELAQAGSLLVELFPLDAEPRAYLAFHTQDRHRFRVGMDVSISVDERPAVDVGSGHGKILKIWPGTLRAGWPDGVEGSPEAAHRGTFLVEASLTAPPPRAPDLEYMHDTPIEGSVTVAEHKVYELISAP